MYKFSNGETKTQFDFMPYWKNEEKCYEEAKLEGKDRLTGKQVTTHWTRDMPIEQVMYNEWLKKVRDSETEKFYHKRDKNGNIIKGTGPRHLISQIVRIRTNSGNEYLYSNGYLLGYDVIGDPVRQVCSNPETWKRTDFAYKKEYDQKSMSVKKRCLGPSLSEIVYEMPFNESNLKELFDKRITPENIKELSQKRISEISFCLKDEKNNTVREVKDATGIATKTLDLFMNKDFDYLFNANYLPAQLKAAELRQQAIDKGLIPAQSQGLGQAHGQTQAQGPHRSYL